jgi:hypothetical protein
MNVREGTRRTGIVLGVLGACAGVVLGYVVTQPLWRDWSQQNRFQRLLNTPTVRGASGADWCARHAPGKYKSCDIERLPNLPPLPKGYELYKPRMVDPCYETNASDKGQLHWIKMEPWERDWSKKWPAVGQIVNTIFRLESFAPQQNGYGIALIRYNASGTVTELDLTTGEKIERPKSSTSFPYILVLNLLFPVLGFLIPWGAIKATTWIATGFRTP